MDISLLGSSTPKAGNDPVTTYRTITLYEPAKEHHGGFEQAWQPPFLALINHFYDSRYPNTEKSTSNKTTKPTGKDVNQSQKYLTDPRVCD